MATKTLTITEDAYERLSSFKEGKESFSEVITKLTKRHSLVDLVGILTPNENLELKSHIAKTRKRWRKSVEKTARRVS
jgi:predicted CopG family antitoxin